MPSRAFRYRGFLGLVVFGCLAVGSGLSGRYFAEGSSMDLLMDLLGYLLVVAGVILRTWATLYLGGHKCKELVVAGPYAITRNPLYLGSFLIGLAFACLLQSFTVAVGVLLAGPCIYFPAIRSEESALFRRFHGSFRKYRQSVPRLFPRTLKVPSSGTRLEVDLRALRSHLRRSLWTLAVLPAAEFLAHLQDLHVLPHAFHLP